MQALLKRGFFLATRTQTTNAPSVRYFADEPLRDKERAAEKVYFDKEERKVMKKLLDKLEKESQLDRVETESSRAGDAARLKTIFSKYKITPQQGLLDDVLNWKKHD